MKQLVISPPFQCIWSTTSIAFLCITRVVIYTVPGLYAQNLGVETLYHVYICYEVGEAAFYCDLLIFLYLGILQIVGIVLAFQTRSVEISVLNESKFVAAFVYFSSIVFVALVIGDFALESRINYYGGIFSGGLCFLQPCAWFLLLSQRFTINIIIFSV